MFLKKTFIQLRNKINKFIYIFIIFTCVFTMIAYTEVQAAQYTEKYTSSSSFKSSTYPGYTTLLDSLNFFYTIYRP